MLSRIWNFCCSLKLAIVLASLATLLAIGGSLLMHFNPQVFAGLDSLSLAEWYRGFGSHALLLSSWLYLTGLLIALLGINTLCCFIDWLLHVRGRWRKTGEYLIHLGFVLVIGAYFWGSLAGDRRDGIRMTPGEFKPLPFNPGYYLRLDTITPVIGTSGRPVDIEHRLTVLRGEQELQQSTLRANTPLLLGDTIVVANGSGQQTYGYRAVFPDLGGSANLVAGGVLPLLEGKTLTVNDINFEGAMAPFLHLTLNDQDEVIWNGWYSMRQKLPQPLVEAGFRHVVRGPLQRPYSTLMINRDPGWPLAMAGCVALTAGVLFALFSFYAKRRRGDRPEVS